MQPARLTTRQHVQLPHARGCTVLYRTAPFSRGLDGTEQAKDRVTLHRIVSSPCIAVAHAAPVAFDPILVPTTLWTKGHSCAPKQNQ